METYGAALYSVGLEHENVNASADACSGLNPARWRGFRPPSLANIRRAAISDTRPRARGAYRVRAIAFVSPSKQKRAQGRPGAHRTHGPRATKARGRTTGTGGSSGLPCAMVLRLIRALSGDHAWLPPSSARRVSVFANLAPASEAPRPHDFAVRTTAARRARIAPGDVRPSHPAPNVRDDREPPLDGTRQRQDKSDLGQSRNDLFLHGGLDSTLR